MPGGGGSPEIWGDPPGPPRISLNTLTLPVRSEKVYTRHGVPISVTGIAQVKIQGQNKEMLAAACQMFLGKSESEIGQIALETLEGHQRAIMAHMTVEEIYKDRQKFSDQVFRVASSDLVNMGISVVSYTLKDVHDEQDDEGQGQLSSPNEGQGLRMMKIEDSARTTSSWRLCEEDDCELWGLFEDDEGWRLLDNDEPWESFNEGIWKL
nr:flotillin-1 [Zonotrichia albicollis]